MFCTQFFRENGEIWFLRKSLSEKHGLYFYTICISEKRLRLRTNIMQHKGLPIPPSSSWVWVQFLTGLAIYKPVQFYWLCWFFGGYNFARILHFSLTLVILFFFIIHIVQVVIAGWNNFRSVISGFEVVTERARYHHRIS